MFQELIDQASSCLDEGLPFVLYRKPNAEMLNAIFQKDDALHYANDFTETGFVFAPFDLNSNAILLQNDSLVRAPIDLDVLPTVIDESDKFLDESDRAQYLVLVAKALEEIEKGTLDKVVLSRKIEVFGKFSPIALFLNAVRTYPKAFCYLWHHPKVGTWLGATPEILVKSSGQEFTTMSLAGTQNSLDFPTTNWTKKERHEQKLVTDYILSALKEVAIAIKCAEVDSIKAGHLWHLRTKLEGRFAPANFENVLRAIHPTPAVCGIPLENAKNFIHENEFYQRSFYTGFLGEINFKSELPRNRNNRNQENSAYRSIVKKSELFVNLRCMQLFDDKAMVYVGGGITKDSRPEKEWEETVSKSRTMLRILNNK